MHTARVLAVISLAALAAPPMAAPQRPLPINPALLARQWPASWIAAPGAPERDAGVYHFRRVTTLDSVPPRLLVHVSGDHRYVLHVNGQRVGAGPGRGDPEHWRFETYDLAPLLKPGANLIAATVWNFGLAAPMAQMTRRTGFLLQADDPAFARLQQRPGLAGPGGNRSLRCWPTDWPRSARVASITPPDLESDATGGCGIGRGTRPTPRRRAGSRPEKSGADIPGPSVRARRGCCRRKAGCSCPTRCRRCRHDITEPGRVARTTLTGVAVGQALCRRHRARAQRRPCADRSLDAHQRVPDRRRLGRARCACTRDVRRSVVRCGPAKGRSQPACGKGHRRRDRRVHRRRRREPAIRAAVVPHVALPRTARDDLRSATDHRPRRSALHRVSAGAARAFRRRRRDAAEESGTSAGERCSWPRTRPTSTPRTGSNCSTSATRASMRCCRTPWPTTTGWRARPSSSSTTRAARKA